MDKAISLWKAGQLVAIPTETVYGLAADATNGEAVARIYSAKSRPQFNPLIVHVADANTARQYVEWNDTAERLAEAFWPGPLTLVLPRRADTPISELVSAGGDSIAIRCPAHPIARQLLAAWGGGLAAPSANRSGRVSPTTAQHVREELPEVLVVDGGPCAVGIESTVLDLTGPTPAILRPGSITLDQLSTVIPAKAGIHAKPPRNASTRAPSAITDMDPGLRQDDSLKSPGMLESHYAPSIPVRLNAAEVRGDEALLAFGPSPLPGAAYTLNLSARGDLIEAAANLFAHLRVLDDPRHRAIAVMPIPAEGIGEAINDRLRRAAA